MFQPLSRREIKEIINLQLAQLGDLLAQRNIKVEFSRYAMDLLLESGYDPMYGARPLKRVIQTHPQRALKLILAEDLDHDCTIMVDSVEDGKFVFFKK